MKNFFVKFMKEASGATTIEYGLIAAGLSFAIIAIGQGIASNSAGLFALLKSGSGAFLH